MDGSKKVTEYADDYLLEHTGRRCTPQQLAEVNRIWGRMHDWALLEPGVDVVSALRSTFTPERLKLGLLSNIDEREAACWTNSPLSPLFDVVCLSFEIGYSKPSKEAYATVLSRLGADASSSIYVGDGSHDELAGAKEAGFGLVVFMKGFISRSPIRRRRGHEKEGGPRRCDDHESQRARVDPGHAAAMSPRPTRQMRLSGLRRRMLRVCLREESQSWGRERSGHTSHQN